MSIIPNKSTVNNTDNSTDSNIRSKLIGVLDCETANHMFVSQSSLPERGSQSQHSI